MATAIAVAATPKPVQRTSTPLLLPSILPLKPSSNTSNQNPRKRNQRQSAIVVARSYSSSSSFRNESTPETECPVPLDQQPVNEYQNLANSIPFSWAAGDLREYLTRLGVTGASFGLFVGLPVARFGVVDPETEALKCAVGAISGGLLVVTLAVLRMYLGWAYVGNRLLSATVEYEETGWYDGQVWVKTPEVLARDRLLGSFSVKPVLSRVKFTLVGLALSLVICVLLLIKAESPKDFNTSSEAAEGRTVAGVYNDDSARSFEPDAFCGDPGVP
eukprot:TRINITY_DN24927_c0_g1_i1.p1 TRINITY_DN24927_c0_g1~~TRINITY_DN24927_c0_g1_i1.p1  ORF type:complete len:288 (+),score=30.18 TRINITY_DN24927_c0_g1_i1:45-866(+)